jgi:signal transduction histidine kinase
MKYFKTLIFLLLFTLSCDRPNSFTEIKAINGEMDLTNWNFENQGDVALDGDWDFYWNQFLSPKEILEKENSQTLNKQKDFLSIPGNWKGKIIDKLPLAGSGYATIHLFVKLLAGTDGMAIRIPVIGTANKVWIDDKLIFEAGKIGKSKEEMVAYLMPENYLLNFQNKNEFHITVQISNYMDRTGGVWGNFVFGTAKDIFKQKITTLSLEMMVFGGLFIMGIYHFGLFYTRTKDKSTLFFGLFCINFAIRSIVTEERILMTTFPSLTFDFTYRLEYICGYLAFPFFVSFMYYLFEQEMNKRYMKTVWLFISFLCATVFFFPHYEYTHFLIFFEILVCLSIPYLLYANFSAIFNKKDGALTSFLGIIILAIGAVIDILHNEHIVFWHYVTPFTLFGFLFFQSFSLSTKFSKAFQISEDQSIELKKQRNTLTEINNELTSLQKELEQKVKLRTEELEFIYNQNLLEIQKVNVLEKEIAIQKERQELFVDIHDNLGGKLLILSLQLKSIEPDKTISKSLKARIVKTIDEILRGLRNHLLAFEDISLIEKNFSNGFKNFLIRRYSTAGRKIELVVDKDFSFIEIPKEFHHNLFSILQEIINNDLKYGRDKTNWKVNHSNESIVFQMATNSEYKDSFPAGNGHKTIEKRTKLISAVFNEKLENEIYACELKLNRREGKSF